MSRSTGTMGRSTITCSLTAGGSMRRLGGGATGVTEGGRGARGAWIRTRPTAPVGASMYQGPLSATITPERGGSVAAEAEANSPVAPLTRRLPPACHRAWPLSTSASSTSATAELGRLCGVRCLHPAGRRRRALVGRFIVGGNGPWRGRGGDPAALADQQGGDDAGVRVIAGCQFEDDPLAFLFGGRVGEGVEEGLLFGPPRAGNRSSAANAAAARCSQPGTRQVQRWSNTTRRPSREGVIEMVWVRGLSWTVPVMVSAFSWTSTPPARPRVRPRVRARALKMRPRS